MDNKLNQYRLYKGLHQDNSYKDQPEGTYRFALNATHLNKEGNYNFLSNEVGNELCVSLPTGYRLIGSVYIGDNRTVLFSTNNTMSEIGIEENCVYTQVLSFDLGFNWNYQIDATHRTRKGCEDVVYFTDNLNPVRYINLTDLSVHENDLGVYEAKLFNLFPDYAIPCFDTVEVINGGELRAGTYNFAIQLLNADLNGTPWIYSSQLVQVYHNDNRASLNSIKGSSQSDVDKIGGRIDNTSKAIQLGISGLDSSFSFYRIAKIEASGFNGIPNEILASPPIPISTTSYIVDGNIDGWFPISINEILVKPDKIERAKHIEQLENRLILANTKGKQVDFCSFQPFASQIASRYVVRTFDADSNTEGHGVNSNTYWENMSFMGDEVYAMGIVYVFEDGSESPAYHIPGPAKNKRWDFDTDTCLDIESDALSPNQDSDQILTWNQDIEHLVPKSDEVDYNAGIISRIERWRVYDTAIPIDATKGHIGFWEASQQTYLDILDCNGNDYWGSDFCGVPLVGSKIRHHKFPSRFTVPQMNGTSNTVTSTDLIMTLEIVGTFPFGQNLDAEIQVDVDGSPVTILVEDILESRFVNNILELTIYNDFGFIDVGTATLTGGTLLAEVPANITVAFSTQAGSSSYTQNRSVTQLGIQFDNITYPHPNIVGHYFVRGNRDNFNRTVLTKGFSNPLKEKTVSGRDYITFSYFANESDDSIQHHYLMYPEHLYDRNVKDPVYIKHENTFNNSGVRLFGDRFKAPDGDAVFKGINTLVEGRVMYYDTVYTPAEEHNYNVEKQIYLDGLTFDDNFETDHKLYNLSHTNRVHTATLNRQIPRNDTRDLPYVSLKIDRDIHTDLFNIEYQRMHNCMYTLQNSNVIYGGDTFVTNFQVSNTLFFEFHQNIIDDVIKIFGILVAGGLAVLTAGAAAPAVGAALTTLGITTTASSIATVLTFGIAAASAIGVSMTAINTAIEYYKSNGLQIMAEDAQIDGIQTRFENFMSYANEAVTTVVIESDYNLDLRQDNYAVDNGEFYRYSYDPLTYFRDKILYYDQSIPNETKRFVPRGAVSPEFYHYNKDYSRENLESIYFPLPTTYNCCSECREKFPNRIHYSQQSFSEENTDNYRSFLINNYTDVEANTGEITEIVRRQNGLIVLTKEALWQLPQNLQERITNEIVTFIGTGDYFGIPARKILDAEIKSAGCTNKWSVIKTNKGVFYANQLEGSIYRFSGQGVQEISSEGLSRYFERELKNHLAQQIYTLTGYKYTNLESIVSDSGVGMKVVYDSEHDRIIFTKKDYLIAEDQRSQFAIIDSDVVGALIDGQLYYDTFTSTFGIGLPNGSFSSIEIGNEVYFENKSFTISYSLSNGTWTSWHSYLPLQMYYNQNTFYTLIDNRVFEHISNSYCNFYTETKDHIVEVVMLNNPLQNRLTYHVGWIADNFENTFDRILAYNSRQITGIRNLVTKDRNTNYLSQQIVNNNDTLIDNNEGRWFVNNFRDIRTNNPLFTSDWQAIAPNYFIDKVPNTQNPKVWNEKEMLRDEYLVLRLYLNNSQISHTTQYFIDNTNLSIR